MKTSLCLVLISFAVFADITRPPLDIEFDDPKVSMIAGIRPYRKGGIRMEGESIKGVKFFHNYGHGGAGMTLSWGTVEEVVGEAKESLKKATRVAVVGGGVIGLTTALELIELGYRPTVYAASFGPKITSYVAGGLWKSAAVDLKGDPNQERAKRVVKRSLRRFQELKGFPVKTLPYFVKGDPKKVSKSPFGLDEMIRLKLLPPLMGHDRLPIEGVTDSGREYESLLIDSPLYMKELRRRVEEGAVLITHRFKNVDAIIERLGEGAVVFNCTGFGSAKLFGDKKLVPIRGQLVLIQRDEDFPPSDEDFMAGSFGGYYFPRKNELVLGGTYEEGIDDPTPNPKQGREIFETHRKFFGF